MAPGPARGGARRRARDFGAASQRRRSLEHRRLNSLRDNPVERDQPLAHCRALIDIGRDFDGNAGGSTRCSRCTFGGEGMAPRGRIGVPVTPRRAG